MLISLCEQRVSAAFSFMHGALGLNPSHSEVTWNSLWRIPHRDSAARGFDVLKDARPRSTFRWRQSGVHTQYKACRSRGVTDLPTSSGQRWPVPRNPPLHSLDQGAAGRGLQASCQRKLHLVTKFPSICNYNSTYKLILNCPYSETLVY